MDNKKTYFVLSTPIKTCTFKEWLVLPLRADKQRAKTASPMSVTGTPYSKAAMPVHLPVPFWPAVSRIFGSKYFPVCHVMLIPHKNVKAQHRTLSQLLWREREFTCTRIDINYTDHRLIIYLYVLDQLRAILIVFLQKICDPKEPKRVLSRFFKSFIINPTDKLSAPRVKYIHHNNFKSVDTKYWNKLLY